MRRKYKRIKTVGRKKIWSKLKPACLSPILLNDYDNCVEVYFMEVSMI